MNHLKEHKSGDRVLRRFERIFGVIRYIQGTNILEQQSNHKLQYLKRGMILIV